MGHHWTGFVVIYNIGHLREKKRASIADQWWKCKLLECLEHESLDRGVVSDKLNEILKDFIPKDNKYEIHSEGLESTPVKRKSAKNVKKKNDVTTDDSGRATKKSKDVQAETSSIQQDCKRAPL